MYMNVTQTASKPAPRFALAIPLQYRVQGQLSWHDGRMENISRSGVLFRGQHPVQPDTPVEVRFALPTKLNNEPATEVICSGRIVRTVQASGTTSLPGFAARILGYRFVRGLDEIDERG